MADQVHRLVNLHRERRGLDELDLDDDLSRIAAEHSRAMAAGEVPFGHAGFDDRARGIRRATSYRRIGENVGYNVGMSDPPGNAVERWLNSAEHLANIEGDYEETGVGVARNASGEHFFTQIFVQPSE